MGLRSDMPELTTLDRNVQRLTLALDCLSRGNLPAADILCRNILDNEPQNANAWNALGAVAARLQQYQRAIEYFERAKSFGSVQALRNAEQARMAMAKRVSASPASERYLLIKSWGHGFW